MRKQKNKRAFTLLEVLVAITVFAVVMTVVGGTLVSIQQAWRNQRETINLVQNAAWALEFIANEVRTATIKTAGVPAWLRTTVTAGGRTLGIGRDPDADNAAPWQEIEIRRQGASTVLERHYRQRVPNTPWQAWEELANFIVVNPDLVNDNTGYPPGGDGPDPMFIYNNGLVTIELTLRMSNRDYTLRTQVRPRN